MTQYAFWKPSVTHQRGPPTDNFAHRREQPPYHASSRSDCKNGSLLFPVRGLVYLHFHPCSQSFLGTLCHLLFRDGVDRAGSKQQSLAAFQSIRLLLLFEVVLEYLVMDVRVCFLKFTGTWKPECSPNPSGGNGLLRLPFFDQQRDHDASDQEGQPPEDCQIQRPTDRSRSGHCRSHVWYFTSRTFQERCWQQ